MTIRSADHDFLETGKIYSIHVGQSDDPGISKKIHKGHIDLVFPLAENIRALTHKLRSLEGIDRMTVTGCALDIGIGNGHDAFNVVRDVLNILSEDGFISHDELLASYKDIGLTDTPKKIDGYGRPI